MDEQAVGSLYGWAQTKGYPGTMEEFVSLLQTDEGAFSSAYGYAQEQGFPGDTDSFGVLVGRKKKDDTESVSEVGSLEPPVVEGFEEQAERARNLRPTARLNEDGTESTVLMASMEVDGKNVAIPTLFPKDPNNVTSNPEDWMELDAMEAYNTALERGEVFEFETPDEANAFAEGSWKVDTPVEQPRTEADQFFDMALEAVTPELIDRPDDRDTAMELNKLLGAYGFTFETTPFDFNDRVNVKAANGQEISINLDPILDIGRDKEARRLRNFIVENRKESENIARQADDYQEAKLQFANQRQIDENVARLNEEANDFQQFQRDVEQAALDIQKKHAGLNKYTEEYLRANPEEYDEYKAQYDAYAADMAGLEDLQGQLQRRSQELLYANQEINRAAGEYLEVQGGISTNLGLVKRALVTGAARIARGTVDLLVDIGTPGRRIDMFAERDTDSYKQQFIETAREMGVVGIPEEGAMDWVDGVGDALRNDVEVKMLDDYSKAIKFGGEDLEKMVGFTPEQKEFIGEQGLGQQAFDGMMWAFGELERDPTAFELAKENWWGGAILGAFESVPAFIGLGKSAFGKLMGAGTRLGRLYTQTSDHVDEEFRKDPELRDISEKDKLKLKAPLALTVAALEQLGFRNIVQTRNLAGKIVLGAMRKPTERAAGRTLSEVITRDVNNAFARGALTAASGAVAEFETGFLQEGADIGMKSLWNATSQNAELKTPEGAGDVIMAMLNGGAQEAVGSFVLSAPTAVGAAANKSDFSKLSNAELAVFEWMSNPGNRGATKPMIAAHLKNLVNQGKLTGAEAKAALDGYERTVQAFDGIRGVEDMTPEQKKSYLAMELRKQELQKQLDGRAAPFRKAIQQEIDDLGIRQQEIADAVQEQSTEKVSPRDESGARAEVGEEVQDEQEPAVETQEAEEEVERDSLFEQAGRAIIESGIADAGPLMRELKIGYNRASKIIEQLERAGVVSEFSPEGRDVLMDETALDELLTPTEEVAPTEEVTPTEEAAPELTEEERAEAEALEAQFGAEGTPDVTETTDAGVDVRTREGSKLTKKQQRYVEQANNVLKALQSVIPDVKVVAYQTTEQYREATGRSGSGVYFGKTIHINLAKANSRTAFHEAFHAIFLQQIKDGDPEAQAKAKALLRTIRKAIPPKSVLANRIDNFLTQYEEQDISEEALSEVFGYIASGYTALGPQVKSKIKAAIKKVIESVIGRKLGSQWSQGDQAVLDAMRLLAGKVERGEALTEEDVAGIEVSEEAAAKEEAEAELDRGISAIQKLRQDALSAANDVLGPLAEKVTKTDKGRETLRKLVKRIDDKKLASIEKKMRDAKKSKKMSEADKAERMASLQRDAEAEMERLAKEREAVAKEAEEALEKLKPIEEKQEKESKLADIKRRQKEITAQLAKDKREAKKAFKDEELKEYVKGLTDEAETKRAALRDEIAELRGEKKKAEEEAPVEEAPVQEDERIAKERAAIQRLEKKLVQAKRDLKAFEERGAKKSVIEKAKKAVADIEFDIQDRTENIKELEDEIAKREAPPINEQPTIGTIRTKVGVEAFGELEAAVREYMEYRASFADPDDMARGQRASLTRRMNKAGNLSEKLGLTDAEQAVVLNSVREKIEAEKRAAEANEAEAAERKAAAERAKKANEKANLELFLKSARAELEEVEAELVRQEEEGAVLDSQIELVDAARAEVARLESELGTEAPVKKAAPEPTVDDAEVARLEEELRQAQEDLDFYNRDEPDNTKYPKYKSFKQAKEAINAGKDPRFKGKEDNPTFPAQGANENLDKKFMAEQRIPFITGMETTMVMEDSARAALESINRTYRATKSRDTTGVGQELEDTVEALKKELAEAKAKKAPAKPVKKKAPAKKRVAKKRTSREIFEEMFGPETEQARAAADARNKQMMLEMQAEVEGISVEELTKREAEKELQRKDFFGRDAARELKELKGKTDKKSVARRKELKQFQEDLGTMSVDEARAKLTKPKAREQKASEVLGRYKFRPDGSLIGDSRLASELRGYVRKFGFGVEQFGDRDNRFYIVDDRGRRVKPADVIASDEAFIAEREAIEAEQREAQAAESLARAEAEDLRSEGLKKYQDQYLDFPEGMIPPSRLSAREQRSDLGDSTEGFSTSAVVKFAKERGYSDKAILAVRPGAEQAIAEYDAKAARVNREIQGIIQRTRERVRREASIQAITNKGARAKAVNDRIEEAVLEYLRGSKFYKDASDVGREAMELNVKRQMGRRIKSSPKPGTILDAPKDKTFTIKEKDLLRQKIRDMARSSRNTAAAIAQARRELAKDVAKLRKAGALTPSQATALLGRMARTNPLNEASVNSFVEYAARVFEDADYAAKINRANKLRKRAWRNVESGKIGVAKNLTEAIRVITGINAEIIPEAALEDYMELIEMLGERKAVLDLSPMGQVEQMVDGITNEINQELNAKDELLSEFENFEDKVYTKEGKVSIAKTIKAMVEAEVITEDEAKLLRKYSQELFPEPEGKTEEELENARRDEKMRLLTAVESLPNLVGDFGLREENDLVRQFNQLIRTASVENLDNAELKNLLRVANNIQNGFVPHMAEVLTEKLDAFQRSDQVMESIYNDKSGIARLFDRTRLTSLSRRGRKNPQYYIDQVWGDFKTKRIYKAVFEPLAKASATFRSELQGVEARMDRVENELIKSLGRDPNKITRAKFLLGAYMMQKEFEANEGRTGVYSAVDLLDATIDQARTRGNKVKYTPESAEVLQSIRDEIEGMTASEIEALLSPAQKAVAEEIRKINDELTPKANYTASVLRGMPFRPYSQYFHRVVLTPDQDAGTMFSAGNMVEALNTRLQATTKAKNLIEREGGAPPAVSFDPFASVNRGAKFILTDYHMTKPVRTAYRMLKDLENVRGLNLRQEEMLDLIDGSVRQLVKDQLVQTVNQDSLGSKIFNAVRKVGYQLTLGQVERAFAEFGSNLGYALTVDPAGFREGQRYRGFYRGSGADILRNVGSAQTTRLFPDGEGTEISSSALDQFREATSPGRAEIRKGAANAFVKMWANTGGRLQNVTGKLADKMITTPDKAVSRPLWFGSFARAFEAQTGQKPDMDKIAKNDADYMNQYRGAIELATEAADDTSIKAGATDNIFLGMLNGTIRPDASLGANVYAFINSYMTRFLVFEYVTTRTAVNAMVGNGMITRGQGAALMGGVTVRMMSYTLMAGLMRDLIASIYGDDEFEEEDFLERIKKSLIQGAATLVLGGTRGQLGRGAIAIPVELINRDMLEEGEYDFDKRVMMPLFDINQDKQWKGKMWDAVTRTSGPLGPSLRFVEGALGFVAEEIGAKKKRQDAARQEQEYIRSLIKGLGVAGLLPFANDINYHYQRYIYKDLDKEKKPPLPGTPRPR